LKINIEIVGDLACYQRVFNLPFMIPKVRQRSSKTNKTILLTNRRIFGSFMSKVLEPYFGSVEVTWVKKRGGWYLCFKSKGFFDC